MSEYLSGDEIQSLLDDAATLGADEVLTHAHCRDVELPGGAGTAALITLDNGKDHTRPNTLGPKSLVALWEALDATVDRDDIVAVAITGKPFILAAGADLSQIGAVQSRDDAYTIARLGHAVLHRLHTCELPTFGLLNGLALGGGLEVMLHCDYRTVSTAVPAVALPETFLGLVPGWGGAFLVPNLIGPEKAVKVIIENPLSQNRTLTGPQVFDLGLADVLIDSADFLAQSLAWVGDVVSGRITVERPDHRGDADAWEAAVTRGTAIAHSKIGDAAPAPHRALQLIRAARTHDRPAAYRAEDEALADLIMSEELRASLYAFDLNQKRARRPAGAPDKSLARKVTKVGIVGAGLMASQLALLFARRLKVPVVMSDLDQSRVDKGLGYVATELDKLAARGRLDDGSRNRLGALVTGTTDQADFADCDFVIEAVFEEMSVKKQVFAALEDHVNPDCLLATNTSSLSISDMAADLQHPERVVGFHFFNPVAVLPLLEVIRAEQTDDATTATALSVAKELRKNAVLVADAPAFVVNRVLVRMLSEITKVVDEGTDPLVADHALDALGLPMSPFVLLQLVGPAIALHVAETLQAAFGNRFHVSENLRAIVDAGRPGILDFGADGAPYVSDETRALLTQGDAPVEPQEIRRRVEDALAEEIGLMLAEGVVAAPMDIDLCLLLGAGWPFHLGGITPYLDRAGVSERVNGERFLPPGVASLPQ